MNSSQILVALPSRESKFPGFHLGRENSKMEKEKTLSGLCKQISPVSKGFFQHQEEMVQNMSRNSITIFYCAYYFVDSYGTVPIEVCSENWILTTYTPASKRVKDNKFGIHACPSGSVGENKVATYPPHI